MSITSFNIILYGLIACGILFIGYQWCYYKKKETLSDYCGLMIIIFWVCFVGLNFVKLEYVDSM